MDSDPDSLPTGEDPSGPCPRCGRTSNFTIVDRFDLRHKPTANSYGLLERATHLQCQGCKLATVVVETRAAILDSFKPVSWWPTPGSGDTRHSAVPEAVAEAFEEGVRAQAVLAPHAAAAMFRSALAQIVQDKGSEAAKGKKSLDQAVKQMVLDGTLWTTFGDWADHIRAWGNAGAHPEIFGPVRLEDASDLRGLVNAMLDFLYIQPDKFLKAQPARKP